MLIRLFILTFFVSVGFCGDQSLFIPQIGHGAGLQTTFNFMNLSPTTNRIEVRTFDDLGNPVPLLAQRATPFGPAESRAALGIELAGFGSGILESLNSNPAQIQVGYAEISADAPFGVEVVFRSFSGAGTLLSSTTVLPQAVTDSFSFIGFSDSFSRSGLALLNPGSNSAGAIIQLDVFNRFGELVASQIVELAPGEKLPRFIDEAEFFPELAGQPFLGTIEVRSNLPVAVTIIKLEGQGFFTTQVLQPPRQIP